MPLCTNQKAAQMNRSLMKIHAIGKSEKAGASGTSQKKSQMNGGIMNFHAIDETEEKSTRCTKKGRRNQEQAERYPINGGLVNVQALG